MANFTDFIKNNVAPYGATKIGVYNSDGDRVGEIPLGTFKPNYGERLYRVGLLSDVHNEESQASENAQDFINALTVLNNKESIEFICITGDLTQYSHSTGNIATEMAMYQSNLNSAGVNKPVYVTTGNHDCPGSSDIDYTTFYQYAGLSDIAPSSGATASYEVTKTHITQAGTVITDHFLFLTMRRYEFTSSTYYDADITWLGNKLEEYKADRCFVFTHMFFPTYAGNLNNIYPSGNWLSGNQLTSLKNLIDSYPRTYWFSGHSHWKWYLQKYQDRANVYPTSNSSRTTGWAIHLPSCATPIDSDGTSRNGMALQSEGGVMDIYEDYVDIRGIEFKGPNDDDYNFKYIPVAQYRLYTDHNYVESTPFSITYHLTHSTSSNTNTNVYEGSSYVSDITVNSGYTITNIIVTMDGEDISSTAVSGTHISITNVTGDIEITVESSTAAYSVTYNLSQSTATNTNTGLNNGDTFTTELTHKSGYRITNVVVTMGGNDISSSSVTNSTSVTDKTITINNVTGDVVITVTTEQALNTLVGNCNATSSGLAIVVPDSTYTYLKYDAIKVSTADGTDITEAITSTGLSASNSYKVGAYTNDSKYVYLPAGDVLTLGANTGGSNGTTQIPLIQASSSSSVATTAIYVQVKGLKYSANQIDWIEVNNGSAILNGSQWGKNDIPWGWFENITDDPTTLTLSTSGTNVTT